MIENFKYVFYVVSHLYDGDLVEDVCVGETRDINEAFFICEGLADKIEEWEGWYSVEVRKIKPD